MIQPDQFDAFYKRARTRLLLQTYALTGDLPAARSAVRDAFVMTWHHWRKVSRLPDPEDWVRPHAWSQAHRRHTARLWHRDKNLDAEAKETLAALGKLSYSQRKALVLGELTDLSAVERARELGVPRAEGDRLLEAACEKFVTQREVAPEQVGELFEPLRDLVSDAGWPRASIIRRSGASRRRNHTMLGAVAALVAVVATGTAVGSTPVDLAPDDAEPETVSPEEEAAASTFDADHLLTSETVAEVVGGRWTERRTTDNSEGDGLATPCQQQRYADAAGVAALVRDFRVPSKQKGQGSTAVQVAELSADTRSAHRAWVTTAQWYGGCLAPGVQLVETHEVKRLGDEAAMFELRKWAGSPATYLVGVARAGLVTTTTFIRTTGSSAPEVQRGVRLLAEAVEGLCRKTEGSGCSTGGKPTTRPINPVKVGETPGLLGAYDVPPVTGVGKPWVGTEPRQAKDNAAATGCDRADFSQKPMSNAVTRTFLIPEAKLPAAFGLTETAGTMPAGKARAFVATVRNRMQSCEDRDPGMEVTPLASSSGKERDLAVWRVTSEVSDDQTVTYLMGVARDGTAVGQVGFVPAGGATFATGDFDRVVRRAASRLQYMPRPER